MTPDKGELDSLALEFLEIIRSVINWRELPEDIRKERWKVLAKRIMASSGEDLQEFLQNVVRGIAGDEFIASRELGGKLEDLLKKIENQDNEKKLIGYSKARAIPLVIRLLARTSEREEPEKKEEGE